MRSGLVIALLLAVGCGGGTAGVDLRALAQQKGTCVGCHADLNPGLVLDHYASPHNSEPLECEVCHGSDHNHIFRVQGAVPPTKCATCHEAAYEEMRRSLHGQRLREGKLDALLAHATPSVGGCTATNGCHSIQRVYEDGSVGRCVTCHVSHAFRNEQARDPKVCLGCHSGADNPQYESWLRSSHCLASPSGTGPIADCVECHGAHDVSAGIVHGLPPVPYEPSAVSVPAADPEEFARERAVMEARCRKCHSARTVRNALLEADRWRNRGAVMLDRAARIVSGLHRDGLLDLPPEARVPNPVAGHLLHLGGAQVFDHEVSLPERIYYEMHFHHYPALWRAVYHADPARITWHANDALKSALDRLLDIERRLRRELLVTEEENQR